MSDTSALATLPHLTQGLPHLRLAQYLSQCNLPRNDTPLNGRQNSFRKLENPSNLVAKFFYVLFLWFFF